MSRYGIFLDVSRAPAEPLDLFNPVYGQPATAPFNQILNLSIITDTLGIYIQDQVTLAENLKLLLGGRLDLFEQTNQNNLADTKPVDREMPSVRVRGLFISRFNPFLSMPATVAHFLRPLALPLMAANFNQSAVLSMKLGLKQM